MVRWMQTRGLRYQVAAERGQGLPAVAPRQEEVHP
jgi:hypothetical protein